MRCGNLWVVPRNALFGFLFSWLHLLEIARAVRCGWRFAAPGGHRLILTRKRWPGRRPRFVVPLRCKWQFTSNRSLSLPERLRSPSRRLRRVMVERLVRVYFWLFCSHSQILASALPSLHPVRVAPGLSFSSRTSGVSGPDTLWRVRWTPLLDGVLFCFPIPVFKPKGINPMGSSDLYLTKIWRVPYIG